MKLCRIVLAMLLSEGYVFPPSFIKYKNAESWLALTASTTRR